MKNCLKSVLFFAALAVVTPCKSNTPPCSGENFNSTKEVLRAKGIFSTTNIETAKKLVGTACVNSMSRKIGKALNIVVPNYYSGKKQEMSEDAKTKLKNFRPEIPETKSICEESVQNGENQKLHRVVEVGFEQVVKPIHIQLVNDNVLPKSYDYKTFSEDFYNAIKQVEKK